MQRLTVPAVISILFIVFTLGESSAQSGGFIKAADGSVLDQAEQSGGIYYDQGVETDAYAIFRKYGFTHIRLKIWHTPADQYNSLPNVVKMAQRAREMGLGTILDFHYSDTWADPGHQSKPAAWAGLSFEALSDSVYHYTNYVVTRLKAAGALPDMIQVGNEITCGMLWDEGRVCNPYDTPSQWQQLGALINKAIEGARAGLETGEEIRVILHFDNGGNNGGCVWFYDNIRDQQIPYDVIGLSFYPWWHGTLGMLEYNLDNLAGRYDKDIMVVEMAYPWTLSWNDNTGNLVGTADQLHEGYPATPEGQYQYLSDLIGIVRNVEGGKGIGVAYWSPEWICTPNWGSPWENVALFDFDNEVLESIKAFEDHNGIEAGSGRIVDNLGCHPNPFHDKTVISFQLNRPAHVQLSVISGKGEILAKILNEQLAAGKHEISWSGAHLPAGGYHLQLTIDKIPVSIPVMKL